MYLVIEDLTSFNIVLMACRSLEKAQIAAKDIINRCRKEKYNGEIEVLHLDLNSLASVRTCAAKVLKDESRIDVLVNNAGIMACAEGKTDDGFETQFGVNHLGHFLFTLLLLPRIIKTGNARIVNLSSLAHFWGELDFNDLHFKTKPYCPHKAYFNSKLANVVFTNELNRRLQEQGFKGIHCYSMCPGVVATDLQRHFDVSIRPGYTWYFKWIVSWYVKNPWQGAQTLIHCVVDELAGLDTGLYYSDCASLEYAEQAKRTEDWTKLWDYSVLATKLEGYNPFAKEVQ